MSWDERYREQGGAPVGDHGPPPAFASVADLLPTCGTALELACGRGRASVWLARRGLHVHGVDVSPVAIELARTLADMEDLGSSCSFEVWDLDGGLPPGSTVDLVMCHLFWDPVLAPAILARLRPGGTLAIATLSEVGHGPGSFRAPRGGLADAFADLDLLAHREAEGLAVFVGRNVSDTTGMIAR